VFRRDGSAVIGLAVMGFATMGLVGFATMGPVGFVTMGSVHRLGALCHNGICRDTYCHDMAYAKAEEESIFVCDLVYQLTF